MVRTRMGMHGALLALLGLLLVPDCKPCGRNTRMEHAWSALLAMLEAPLVQDCAVAAQTLAWRAGPTLAPHAIW